MRRDVDPLESSIQPKALTQIWNHSSTYRRKLSSPLEATRFPRLSTDPYQQENVMVHILKDRISLDHSILETTAPYIRAQSQLKMSRKSDTTPLADDPIARALTPNYARKKRAASASAMSMAMLSNNNGTKTPLGSLSPMEGLDNINNINNRRFMSANAAMGGGKLSRGRTFTCMSAKDAADAMDIFNRTSDGNSKPVVRPSRNERLRAELASISNITRQGKTPADTIYATPCMLNLIGKTININKMNKEMSKKEEENNRNIIVDSKALYNKFTKIDNASILGARIDKEVSVEEIIKNGKLAILNEHQMTSNMHNGAAPKRYTQVPKFDIKKIPSIITSELNRNRIIVE